MNRKTEKRERQKKMLRLSYLVESLSVATNSQQAEIRKEIKALRDELGLTIRNTPKPKVNEVKVTKKVDGKKVRVIRERINKPRLQLTVESYIDYRMQGYTRKDIAELLNVNEGTIAYFCRKNGIDDDVKLIVDYLKRERKI